jgi:hypothetical protein
VTGWTGKKKETEQETERERAGQLLFAELLTKTVNVWWRAPGTCGNRAGALAKTSFFTECDSGVFRSILIYFDHFDLFRSILILASKSSKHFDRAPAILICFNVCTRLKSQK